MKKTSFIINTSRGGVIDEDGELVSSIKKGILLLLLMYLSLNQPLITLC